MYEYILRWQIGLSLENRKIHYTYGSKEALRKKAKALAKDENIVLITIDKVDEVIKNTISEKIIERFENL
ncbi:TPA: hypothetical protein KR427_001121 [Clostridioides difficile]|jgi:mannitol-1-phosphate/altronate dehydrogenase|uniref:Uncharacterized protein n=3 Tax=root TaxID=1 RepID=A0A0A8WJB6_9CAUD|nr:hypothetical protein [Clostridioides difficile]YP_001110789.1 hypothetical protein phiC2p74 [Clostridioides phage phiC2]YP_009214259.1 hypothetical protein PHIMMP03_20075 [Clostridium phage phiMMP03]OFU43646.1 hypothetical protein HMPREF3071_11770 [Clostridium sp. HMSC19A11]ABE99534.1 hypothetical protein phiC2p74 [Clostridioides phage phiC2]ALP03576.1 hypothetical protein PCZ31_1646 [Clostridioides difficile]AUA20378.1 hypothetical protein CWR55_01095 [Clostridioides difficile]AXU78490.1